jgi:hypothetical protein
MLLYTPENVVMSDVQTTRKCISLGHISSPGRDARVRAAHAHKVVDRSCIVEAGSAGVQEAEKGLEKKKKKESRSQANCDRI